MWTWTDKSSESLLAGRTLLLVGVSVTQRAVRVHHSVLYAMCEL